MVRELDNSLVFIMEIIMVIRGRYQLALKFYRRKLVNWDKVWKTLALVVEEGRRISLSNFVIDDRCSRR